VNNLDLWARYIGEGGNISIFRSGQIGIKDLNYFILLMAITPAKFIWLKFSHVMSKT